MTCCLGSTTVGVDVILDAWGSSAGGACLGSLQVGEPGGVVAESFDGTDFVAPVVFAALGDLLVAAVEEEWLLPGRVLPEREEPESMSRAAWMSFLNFLDLRKFFLP